VWQVSQYSDRLEARPYVVCLLAEAGDFPSLQNIIPALWPIWPFIQLTLWILPKRSSCCCMILNTHMYFVLRLHISVVVTVLSPYVFMGYTGKTLNFSIVSQEWFQYLCGCKTGPQKLRAVWSYWTLCILQFCVVSKHRILLSDDQNWTWKLENLCAYGFSFCVILIYPLCL